MATSESAQATLGSYGVHRYARGDLLRDTATGRTSKLILSECPLCAVDPDRPRTHFSPQESRPDHFREAHGPEDLTSSPR